MAIGPPTGMRDWLPQDALLRQQLMETISRVYRLYGYLPIDTPAMEDLAVLLGKGGGENEKLLFKVLKRGDKLKQAMVGGDVADYGLRFDLTVPLARFVATHQGEIQLPFRRYHIAPVWRADRPQRGRFREFYQCDIDVVGGASPAYEVEIITATERVLKELNLGQYWFRISDKRLLPLLLRGFEVPESKINQIAILFDKMDKVPPMEFDDELGSLLLKDSAAWDKLQFLVRKASVNVDHEILLRSNTDYYKEHFAKLNDALISDQINEICANLDLIMRTVRTINSSSRIIFHPIMVRGMDYYTGPVYEAVMDRGAKIAILGGGRYDNLIGQFGKKNIPAVGCSLGFERILSLLQEREAGHAVGSVPRALLICDEQDAAILQQQAERLRNEGLCIETYLDPDDVGRQFKYAEAAGITWAIKRFDATSASVTVRYLPERRDLTLPLPEFKARLSDKKQA
jgi:histidyl-tRNA synthetase